MKSWNDQIKRRKELETVHENELDTDRQDNFSSGVLPADHGQEILVKPAEFPQIWEGCFDGLDMAKQCIDWTSQNVCPINLTLYSAGLKAREIEKT